MPPPLLTDAGLALCLAGTTDLQPTFVEHEDLETILVDGKTNFDIQNARSLPRVFHNAPSLSPGGNLR